MTLSRSVQFQQLTTIIKKLSPVTPHKLAVFLKIATAFAQPCASKIRFKRFFNGSKNFRYLTHIDKYCSSTQLQPQFSGISTNRFGSNAGDHTCPVMNQALLKCSTSASEIGSATSKSHPSLVNISVFASFTVRQLGPIVHKWSKPLNVALMQSHLHQWIFYLVSKTHQ